MILAAYFHPDGSMSGQHLAAVPKRSKFKAGDWVRLHGYVGCIEGWERWGFRGFVLGGYSTDLRGLTDDGMPWVASASVLTRDGERPNASMHCVCCPRPSRRRKAKSVPKGLESFGPPPECLRPYLPAEPVQLDLFEVAA